MASLFTACSAAKATQVYCLLPYAWNQIMIMRYAGTDTIKQVLVLLLR